MDKTDMKEKDPGERAREICRQIERAATVLLAGSILIQVGTLIYIFLS